ncbi:serine hydrolase, partial [Candidatus Darwinibacter acetoxidans]
MSENHALRRSSPESQGLPSAAVCQLLDYFQDKNLEVHSIMILRHGNVVAEGWWDPYSADRPHMLFSLSKSFTSTAIGFAVQEGLLTVDDALCDFFPGELP